MSSDVEAKIIAHVTELVGSTPQRASVTFLGVEPIDVLRFAPATEGQDLVFVTVGCARHPMSDPGDLNPDPVRGPRAELVVRMRADRPLPGLHRRLATLAAAPSVEGLILAEDALLDIGEPLWDGAPFTALVTESDSFDDCPLDAPAEPVQFLRAVPITANEAAWMRLKGVDALREAWAEAQIDVRDPARSAASL